MVCKRWSSPDALHWNGLCTNEMRYETDNTKCIVCPYPIRVRRPCATVCSPPLQSPYQFVLDIRKSLTLTDYPYPYDWANSAGTATYRMYDKMPTAEQISAPCVMTATYFSDTGHNCEWVGNMTTTRWYRETHDPANGKYWDCEIVDTAEYGQRTAHPFAACTPTIAQTMAPYPRYACTMQLWGHSWHLTASGTTAYLTLSRDVARHWLEIRSSGTIGPVPLGGSYPLTGTSQIQTNPTAPRVWNVSPSRGWFSFPNTGPLGNSYAYMGTWFCSNICANRGTWVFQKTNDLSEQTTVPGVAENGQPMPVILGLPNSISLSVAA